MCRAKCGIKQTLRQNNKQVEEYGRFFNNSCPCCPFVSASLGMKKEQRKWERERLHYSSWFLKTQSIISLSIYFSFYINLCYEGRILIKLATYVNLACNSANNYNTLQTVRVNFRNKITYLEARTRLQNPSDTPTSQFVSLRCCPLTVYSKTTLESTIFSAILSLYK